MWSRILTPTRSQVALLIGQVVVLLLCIAYIQHFYSVNVLPDKQAKETFVQTTCSLINKKLSIKGRILPKYRSDFLISYKVDNVEYTRWVSGNGLDLAFTRDKRIQEETLSQFRIGESYPCWFHPDNPEIAILVLRHTWLSTAPLIIPSIIGIIDLYFLLKNLFALIGLARANRIERRKK